VSAAAEAVLEEIEPVPLSTGMDGVIRVGGSRVTLDTVAEAFAQGATPEEIAQQYPTLSLADIYSVLGHVLRHREEVAEYLKTRAKEGAAAQEANEQRFPAAGIRERLRARQKAPAGE
jgi:uncharacterized protein (DUF433 family)